MSSFKLLVDSAFLQRAMPGLIAISAVVVVIVIAAVLFAAAELKKQKEDKNAEQSAVLSGEMPDTDSNN